MEKNSSSETDLVALNPELNLSDLFITSGGKETTTEDHRETPPGRMLYSNRIEVYSGQIFEQNGAYLRTCSPFAGNGAALWNSKGSAYITGGGFASNTVTMGNMGGAIYNSEGYLELKNVSFYSNTASDGGAICNDSGTVFISGCSFWENESLQCGGAILTRGGSMYIVNTLFERHFPFASDSNNPVYSNAAVLTIANGAFVSISGGAFINNARETIGGGGGAIDGICDTQLELETVVFYHNSAINGNGGGVYGEGGDFFMDQCAFSSNTATYTGGGFSYSYLMVPGAVSSVNLNDTNFYKNSAIYGGGAYLGTGATISGGLFSSNAATNGGGLFLDHTGTIISGTSFFSNSANSGGAVYCHGDGGIDSHHGIELKDVVFSGNQATHMNCGGALYIDRAHVKINGGSFCTPYDTIINTGTITFCGQNYFDNYILCSNVIEMPNLRIDLRDSPNAKTCPVINWITQIQGVHNEWQIIVDELIEDGTYLLAGKGNMFTESMLLCNDRLNDPPIPVCDLNTGLDVHLIVNGAIITTENYNCSLTLTYEGQETYLSLVIDRIRYDHLYLNSAWSNCNYGDIVCPVSGGTAVFGRNAFWELSNAWNHLYENGTIELENNSFVFYNGLTSPATITFAPSIPEGNRIIRFDTTSNQSYIDICGLSTADSVVCQGMNAFNTDEVSVTINGSTIGGHLICGATIGTNVIQTSSDARSTTIRISGLMTDDLILGDSISANAVLYYSHNYYSSSEFSNANINTLTAGNIIKVNSGTASTTIYGDYTLDFYNINASGLFCTGSKIYAGCSENRYGNIDLFIQDGSYQTICGGDAVLATNATGNITGDISVVIQGGTFHGAIFGSNYAMESNCSLVTNGIQNGDTEIIFESIDDIYLNEMIYGGGSYYHHVNGDSSITFMGDGSKYHFASSSGICGDSQYGNPSGVWSSSGNTGRYVSGTRTLAFKYYTGEFDCPDISCFDKFSLTNSYIEFTNATDLSGINEWAFSNTTSDGDTSVVWFSGLCGFDGDTFEVNSYEDWTLLTTSSSMLSSNSFASLSSVTLNDVAASWNSSNLAWETANDSLSWHNENGIVSIRYTSIV